MVKVGDFGLSKKREADQSQGKTFVGSKPYLAPECFHGSGYGTAADI
jgi:serine/threonine protein kinase